VGITILSFLLCPCKALLVISLVHLVIIVVGNMGELNDITEGFSRKWKSRMEVYVRVVKSLLL
jgi:hypothetical protein